MRTWSSSCPACLSRGPCFHEGRRTDTGLRKRCRRSAWNSADRPAGSRPGLSWSDLLDGVLSTGKALTGSIQCLRKADLRKNCAGSADCGAAGRQLANMDKIDRMLRNSLGKIREPPVDRCRGKFGTGGRPADGDPDRLYPPRPGAVARDKRSMSRSRSVPCRCSRPCVSRGDYFYEVGVLTGSLVLLPVSQPCRCTKKPAESQRELARAF